MNELRNKWTIFRGFRCAYRASGNGIVECNHRTIKALVARARKLSLDVLFWYSLTLLGDAVPTVPANVMFSYHWRNPDVKSSAR